MAAALRLGASQVDGVDIDPNSINAASELLSRFDVGKNWSVHTASLFDLPARSYDIVYSWGVIPTLTMSDRRLPNRGERWT